jgi:inorganic pyrophosphatase
MVKETSRKKMPRNPIAALSPNARGGALRIVIETPKGTRNKFHFDPKLNAFSLTNVLPVGELFPFDFGFVPQTVGEDGDPLDVMLLMDEPAFPGCVVDARVIGVIEAEQTEDGKRWRNDRLIAVARESHLHRRIRSLRDLDSRLLDEIEQFFKSYNTMRGRKFKPLGRYGPGRAEVLVRKGLRARKNQPGH